MSENKVQDEKPKTDQQRIQEFVEEYNNLCAIHGLQFIVNPAYRQRDDGTWSLVLQKSVGRLQTK